MVKNVTLISVGITTVVLVILAGVVYAYQGFTMPKTVSTPPVSSAAISFPLNAPAPTDAPTEVPNVSPQDAASIAAKFSNRTDVYTVEVADFSSSQSYKVTFSSGRCYLRCHERTGGWSCASTASASSRCIFGPPKTSRGTERGR